MVMYCSNKKCNPMAPLLVTVKLNRVLVPDMTIGRCPKCKTKYDIEIMTDNNHKEVKEGDLCPRCNTQLKPQMRVHLECPKCGRFY